MNSEPDKEFDRNLNQLIGLLKKILKGIPFQQGGFPQSFSQNKESGINLNLFFTFLPLAPEDFDELEEIYDQYLFSEDKTSADLSMDLNPSDQDFLRKHGIRF